MRIEEKIPPGLLEKMRSDLVESGGAEVLWVGHVDTTGLVIRIEKVAEGSLDMVPALFPQMEKGDVVIHNHPSGQINPSEPDLAVASRLGENGIGFYIVDGGLRRLKAVTEPVQTDAVKLLDPDQVASVLEAGGALSRMREDYEPRPSQVDLTRLITQALNEDAVAACEAGTGVGKSFAYLIPALEWIKTNKERVVISTATINLQQQLVEKDIPFVKSLLKSDVKAVLVKGRSNYLCPVRLAEQRREATDDSPEGRELSKIAEWSQETKDGSLSDLPFQPMKGLWSRICSEVDACHGLRCASREGCFVTKSRKEAAGAGLLVVNHHLLFADLALRKDGFGYEVTALLPPFQRLVFDEAHGLEKSATSYFSDTLSKSAVGKITSRIYRRSRTRSLGLSVALQGLSTANVDFGLFPELVSKITDHLGVVNTLTLAFLAGSGDYRLKGEATSEFKEYVLDPLSQLMSLLAELHNLGKKVVESLGEEEKELPETFELKTVLRRLETFASLCDRFRKYHEDPGNVYWIKTFKGEAGESQVEFIISPLNVSPFLVQAVYDPFRSVIFTSATLTIQDKFRFWAGRIGLGLVDKQRILSGMFPSPFNYKKRVLLAIPADAPSPEHPTYLPSLISFLEKALEASRGRALVLFTSYDHLSKASDALAPKIGKLGHLLFRQGDDDRARLLEKFNKNTSSVLFATDSFWEGVDSPGDTLKLVVLCKLPFRVPSEPVLAARMEAIEARGGDSFRDYSLPEAVMRFKQGFGRLMRRTSDSGAVGVYDVRLVNKPYGRIFLDSLPPTRRIIGSTKQVVTALDGFLNHEDPESWSGGEVQDE